MPLSKVALGVDETQLGPTFVSVRAITALSGSGSLALMIRVCVDVGFACFFGINALWNIYSEFKRFGTTQVHTRSPNDKIDAAVPADLA
jgi:hypothetical protein